MPDHAARFHALHAGPELLLLANVWDAGSARVIASLGARAIATTSAGVAWSHGYPDGDALPLAEYRAAVRRITHAVSVPVTADIEGGYAHEPAAVGENVRHFIGAGAIGINLEDGAEPPELMCRKIAAVRHAADSAGVDLFINARTDVVLRGLAPADPVAEIVRRAGLYAAAGCNGLFVPGLVEPGAIAAVIAGIRPGLPLNVMARAALPDVATLQAIGVRRLSAGSAISQAVLGLTQRLATDFLAGNSQNLFEGSMAYADINALMAPAG